MNEYNREPRLQEEIKQGLESQEQITEQTEQQLTTEEVIEIPEIEKQARSMGWKSKEERLSEGKDNTFFVEADEYVRRRPLFDKIEKQKKEIDDLRHQTKKTNDYLTQVRKDAYEQALRDLETRREAAVSEANIDEYKRLEAQSKQIKQQMQQDPIVNTPKVTELPQEVLDFGTKHASWYNENTAENAKMLAAAQAVDNFLARQAKIDGREINLKEHLATIESEVKRLFPHRFNEIKQSQNTTPTVAKSTTSKESSTKSNLASKLTKAQRQLGEQFMKSNPEFTLELYASELEKMGRLGK